MLYCAEDCDAVRFLTRPCDEVLLCFRSQFNAVLDLECRRMEDEESVCFKFGLVLLQLRINWTYGGDKQHITNIMCVCVRGVKYVRPIGADVGRSDCRVKGLSEGKCGSTEQGATYTVRAY